ncbi:endonuclease domain-containing protein [Arthrobacter sp. NyZ413]|uniref:endonuclease domain-containing protein n=1 Tax=Arthrobacter sp. NyZ413 TaxID=3144669 RepID=UPI003BF7D8E4
MQKPFALPPELLSGPFTLLEARAQGVGLDQIRRAGVAAVSRGLYRPANWDFDLEGAARALSAATPGAWISHVTAARLRCSMLPPWLADSTELHLSKPRSLPGVRRKGVVGHRLIVAEGEVESVDEILMSTRSRTWLDLAKMLPLNDLVCMGDELIRVPRPEFEGRAVPFATIDELRAMVARHPNLQGVVRAREALDLMRVGSDSGPETLLRLAMFDAGIPEPELQIKLRKADPFSPSADLGFRQRRVAIQYDGAHHLREAQSLSDRRRDKAFEAAGWTVLVFRKDDLEDGFKEATRKIKKTLRSAWVDPAVASGFEQAV